MLPYFDHYYTSDWKRAKETAIALVPDADWLEEQSLGETNGGRVGNEKIDDFLSSNPDFYCDPSNKYPGGESHIDLQRRVVGWLKGQQNYSGDALVVTHSGSINSILHHVKKIDLLTFPAFKLNNLSLTCIEFKNDTWNIEILGANLDITFPKSGSFPSDG